MTRVQTQLGQSVIDFPFFVWRTCLIIDVNADLYNLRNQFLFPLMQTPEAYKGILQNILEPF